MSVSDKTLYTSQFRKHIDSLTLETGVNISEIEIRHKLVSNRIKVLTGIQPLLLQINDMPDVTRTKKGSFYQLDEYLVHVNKIRAYVNSMDIDTIPMAGFQEVERDFQLDLLPRLFSLETFYKKCLRPTNDDKLLDAVQTMGDRDLSLVDLKLV